MRNVIISMVAIAGYLINAQKFAGICLRRQRVVNRRCKVVLGIKVGAGKYARFQLLLSEIDFPVC